MWTRSIIGLMMLALAAFAQTAERPTFEVASVKPVAEIEKAIQNPNFSLGMRVTGQQVTVRLPFRALLEQAYGMTINHVEGPEWVTRQPRSLEEEHFLDITAKLPEGATKAQVALMLQALLEERFKMTVHKTSKVGDTYALLVGKDGPKLRSKEPVLEEDSKFAISANQSSTQIGDAKMTRGPMGTFIIEAETLGGLSYMMSGLLDGVPVIDKTGLQGTFDIKFTMDSGESGEWKDQFRDQLAKLGLRMESQKNPVETLVIDHIEKQPTEN